MIKYNQFVVENIKNLRYSIFDWDDNILFLDTPIHFEHFVNGGWVEETISAKKLVEIKEKYKNYWDNEEWRCDFNKAFNEFRDFGPRKEKAFVQDTIKALREKKYGPSWDSFIETLVKGELFAIVTTRGHEPDTLRKGVEYIIYNELNDEQQDRMLRNLMKYNEVFENDFEYLVDGYLDDCIFIGVMSKYFTELFGYTAHKKPTEGKREAVNYVVKEFSKYGKMIGVPTKIGFSDDDKNYYEEVEKLFIGNKELFDNIDFYVFDTSDPKLKGGRKITIKEKNINKDMKHLRLYEDFYIPVPEVDEWREVLVLDKYTKGFYTKEYFLLVSLPGGEEKEINFADKKTWDKYQVGKKYKAKI